MQLDYKKYLVIAFLTSVLHYTPLAITCCLGLVFKTLFSNVQFLLIIISHFPCDNSHFSVSYNFNSSINITVHAAF